MDPHESDLEGDMSNNEEDMSETELQDEDSGEDVLRIPVQTQSASEQDALAKLKQVLGEYSHSIKPDDFPVGLKRPPPLNMRTSNGNPLAAVSGVPTGLMAPMPFSIPAPFPFPHPAFLPQLANPGAPPASTPPAPLPNNNVHSSGSSHSSESSNGSHQTWSFEEQFKQIPSPEINHNHVNPMNHVNHLNYINRLNHMKNGRTNGDSSPPININLSQELYEINDDPKRKEFLDDLFSFMQKKGTPINRLPIMAKSVLDLYELYNLVVARGGLVDVINKKLWQEIIKGLHLPSSITSAAFTLRTQYMKYLYPYECDREKLSSPQELQNAIDGNRREGRRSSYGTVAYNDLVQRTPGIGASLASSQMSPLSLVTSGRPMMNGNGSSGNSHVANAAAAAVAAAAAAHHPSHHQLNPTSLQNFPGLHPSQPQPAIASSGIPDLLLQQLMLQGAQGGPVMPPLAPQDLDSTRMMDYLRLINKELRNNGTLSPPASQFMLRQGSTSPPSTSISPQQEAYNEITRLNLWNFYQSNPAMVAAAAAVAASGNSIVGPPPNMVTPPSPLPATPVEPQKEALNLGVRESPSATPSAIVPTTPLSRTSLPSISKVKREMIEDNDSPPPKRMLIGEEHDAPMPTSPKIGARTNSTHIKISNKEEGPEGNSLNVSMELNGVMYEGVLFPQNARSLSS